MLITVLVLTAAPAVALVVVAARGVRRDGRDSPAMSALVIGVLCLAFVLVYPGGTLLNALGIIGL